jgi:hypothetical protein
MEMVTLVLEHLRVTIHLDLHLALFIKGVMVHQELIQYSIGFIIYLKLMVLVLVPHSVAQLQTFTPSHSPQL